MGGLYKTDCIITPGDRCGPGGIPPYFQLGVTGIKKIFLIFSNNQKY